MAFGRLEYNRKAVRNCQSYVPVSETRTVAQLIQTRDTSVKQLRICSTPDGESYFEESEISFDTINYAPPAAPLGVSQPVAAGQYVIIKVPRNWDGGMHPAPRRQLMVVLSGADEIIASDGSSHTLFPGDTLLMEDTKGKGHISKCSGETVVLMVHL